MHGIPSPLAGPYNGVPPAGGLAGLSGFPLGAAGLGVRVQGSGQASAVLLVSNLNEEVSGSTPGESLDAEDERPHEDLRRGYTRRKQSGRTRET